MYMEQVYKAVTINLVKKYLKGEKFLWKKMRNKFSDIDPYQQQLD